MITNTVICMDYKKPGLPIQPRFSLYLHALKYKDNNCNIIFG